MSSVFISFTCNNSNIHTFILKLIPSLPEVRLLSITIVRKNANDFEETQVYKGHLVISPTLHFSHLPTTLLKPAQCKKVQSCQLGRLPESMSSSFSGTRESPGTEEIH